MWPILRVAYSHVHLVKDLNTISDSPLGVSMLFVLLHQTLKSFFAWLPLLSISCKVRALILFSFLPFPWLTPTTLLKLVLRLTFFFHAWFGHFTADLGQCISVLTLKLQHFYMKLRWEKIWVHGALSPSSNILWGLLKGCGSHYSKCTMTSTAPKCQSPDSVSWENLQVQQGWDGWTVHMHRHQCAWVVQWSLEDERWEEQEDTERNLGSV